MIKWLPLILVLVCVAAAGVVIYLRAWPKTVPASQQAAGPPPTPTPIASARVLSDGSFSPIAEVKRAPNAPPSDLLKDDWRARYEPLLAKARGADGAPKFYVYPFIDNTASGVGIHCTYGSHLVFSGALALWTNAQIAGFNPPIHYGMPRIEDHPDGKATFAEWSAQALKDPAASEADFVLTGEFSDVGKPGEVKFRAVVLQRGRERAGKEIEIHQATVKVSSDHGFEDLSAFQRSLAKAIPQMLAEKGLVKERTSAADPGLDLQKELSGIAALLDGADNWIVMDGVDRALQLATLSPKQDLPLQAAAYGMNEIVWTQFKYVHESAYGVDYGLRAYALAQLTIALNPEPSLSQMNWILTARPLGHLLADRRNGTTGDDRTGKCPELLAYALLVREEANPSIPGGLANVLPDWQVLCAEAQGEWFIGKSVHRGYLRQRLPFGRDHDLYLQATVQRNYSDAYMNEQENNFQAKINASLIALRGTLATELSTLLLALKGAGAFTSVLDDCLTLHQDIKPKVKSLAEAGDFFGLRGVLADAFTAWREPYGDRHQAYDLLVAMNKGAEAAYALQELRAAPSGFTGIEFSMAERLLLAQRRASLGPMLLAEFGSTYRGSYEDVISTAIPYLKSSPNDCAALEDTAQFLFDRIKAPGAEKIFVDSVKAGYEQFPIRIWPYYRLGRYKFSQGGIEKGRPYLEAYASADPFAPAHYKNMGDLCDRYGYRADAVKFYDRYLEHYSQRYDVAQIRARIVCELGRPNDPKVKEAFDRPAFILPGNDDFHIEKLNYYRFWAKDIEAARRAAENYEKAKGAYGTIQRARVEIEAGDKNKAREYISKMNIGRARDLGPAILHADAAQIYLELDDIPEAEKHVQLAAQVDPGQGNVVFAMARLEEKKGNFDGAIAQAKGYLDRYGANTDATLLMAKCYRKKGDLKQARSLLEKETIEQKPQWAMPILAPELMSIYAEANDAESASKLLDQVIASALLRRANLRDTLDNYKKFDAKKADEIWARVDTIMAGPHLFESAEPAK